MSIVREIVKTTFKELPADALGVVMLACDVSTQENRDGFVTGVTEFFIDHGVIPSGTTPEDAWKDIFLTTTKDGRNDLTFVCHDPCNFNVGRWAAVRLAMGGECKWIEDFVNNQAKDYDEARRGPHAMLGATMAGEGIFYDDRG